jgi:hypothetical protein
LANHRILFKESRYSWNDGDPPASDLLNARLRAKYYGAAYIILRPYIRHALTWQNDLPWPDEGTFSVDQLRYWLKTEYDPEATPHELPQKHLGLDQLQTNRKLATSFLWCCMNAIESAIYSTAAFDGVANPTS